MANLDFRTVWTRLVEENPEQPFLRGPSKPGGESVLVRADPLYRRSLKAVGSLVGALKINPGERVALIGSTITDAAALLHGFWLGEVTVVPLSMELSDKEILVALNNCGVGTVIFSADAAARVTNFIDRAKTVRSWVSCGMAKLSLPGTTIYRFEDLLRERNPSRIEENAAPSDHTLALILHTPGTNGEIHGISFTQGQLLLSALSLAQLHLQHEADERLIWCLLPEWSLNQVLHSYVAPLFGCGPTLYGIEWDPVRFWDQILAMGVSNLQITGEQMVKIQRKARRPHAPLGYTEVFAFTWRPPGQEVFNAFKNRFGITLRTCYHQTECGGMLTVAPKSVHVPLVKRGLVSAGITLPGVELMIANEQGTELQPDNVGEIVVRTPQIMHGYLGTKPGSAFRGQLPDSLHTGDYGFISLDNQGRGQLFVGGRIGENKRSQVDEGDSDNI